MKALTILFKMRVIISWLTYLSGDDFQSAGPFMHPQCSVNRTSLRHLARHMTRASEFTAEMLEKMEAEKKKDVVVVDEKEKKEKPGKNNVPIIKEILKNKKELSGLLGFSNYAGECSSPCV